MNDRRCCRELGEPAAVEGHVLQCVSHSQEGAFDAMTSIAVYPFRELSEMEQSIAECNLTN